MSCEGLADIQSRVAWQLHFSQNPNRSNLFHVYRVGNIYYPAKLKKGRAWIAADNYEVLRLQTDLLEPIGRIKGLQREHLEPGTARWNLPSGMFASSFPERGLTWTIRGRRYQRRHNFSDFQLFSVETGEEVEKGPKNKRKKVKASDLKSQLTRSNAGTAALRWCRQIQTNLKARIPLRPCAPRWVRNPGRTPDPGVSRLIVGGIIWSRNDSTLMPGFQPTRRHPTSARSWISSN